MIGGEQDWYVLCVDEEPVTVAVYLRASGSGNPSVWSLATATAHRRKGYARHLLTHIRAAAPAGPLYIRADTAALATLYESLGYTIIGQEGGIKTPAS